jgi:hypothetical protein
MTTHENAAPLDGWQCDPHAGAFWDDLTRDLLDPGFRAAFEATWAEILADTEPHIERGTN